MPRLRELKRCERGFSAIAVVVAIGALATIIGLAILSSTDAQIRGSIIGLVKRDSDWTVRSSVALVEEAWKKYIGIERVNAVTFTGTVYNDVDTYSRDHVLIDAIDLAQSTGEQDYSLLVLLYEIFGASIDLEDLDAIGLPKSLIYQVDLIHDKQGFENFQSSDASDGIVFVALQNQDDTITAVRSVNNTDNDNDYDIIWNSIDGSDDRQFNAIITVTANGQPHYSSDNAFFVFPVKFRIDLTVRTKGSRSPVEKKVTGLGSCTFYVYRRSFSEYLIFSDVFTTESKGSIVIPKGFTYAGPVHTNTRFSFTGDPEGAVFKDVVTQVEKRAYFNSSMEPEDGWEDRVSYNGCAPDFQKDFIKGVDPITAPTVQDLGDIPGAILGGVSPPNDPGVYLRTSGGTLNEGTELEKGGDGGIYVKGDVESLTLAQGDRQQVYTFVQSVTTSTNQVTYYYNTSNCTGTQYTTSNSSRKSRKTIKTTTSAKTKYTITTDYRSEQTYWTKHTFDETKTEITMEKKESSRWKIFSNETTIANSPEVEVENKSYTGLIDVVPAGEGIVETPQTAIYIDGGLGEGSVDILNTPTGLSGTLDAETELTICAKNSIVINGDTTYESKDAQAKNILGIISVSGKVYVDIADPAGKDVNIDASIMAVNDSNGVFTAYDYQYRLNNPFINLYGGVVQKYYGAVGQSADRPENRNGYSRNFQYDPRLKTSPPPLYPRQSACRMQLRTSTGGNTLQLVWGPAH